jgi:serine phosphatase RsbU (regulator of sigma subunit)
MSKKIAHIKIPLILFILFISAFALCQGNLSKYNVKFVVNLQNSFAADSVYLTGSDKILGNWDASAVLMNRQSDSVWTKVLPFNKDESIEFKVTGGSYWSQALDKDLNIYDNFRLKVEGDTTYYIDVYGWLNKMINGRPVLTVQRFLPHRPSLLLDDLWKYHAGDNPEWAKEDFNDSSWVTTDSYIRWNNPGDPVWNNVGWFRFHFYADSAIWNRTLAILIGQLGASEIYYDGRLLYSSGVIGKSKSSYVPLQNRTWKEFTIDPKYKQVLAVRYENFDYRSQQQIGISPGFAIYLRDLNSALAGTEESWRNLSINQMVFTLIPVILFFLHLLLYVFYPRQRENLFYSICLLGFGGITYFGYQKIIVTNPHLIVLLYRLNGISVPIALFFGLLTAYSINYDKMPFRAWIYFAIFILLGAANYLVPADSMISALNYIYFGLIMLDTIYIIFRKKERKGKKKTWIVAIGFFMLGVGVIYQILIDYSYVASPIASNQVFVYGMVGLIISMSIYLSYNFSYINKDLELQLSRVKELSEKTIEQERTASRLELERRLIDAENERKTKELEEARQLQLSLLPKDIPTFGNYEIAPFMKTASEVGGDYYDVLPAQDGSLTLAIGDATGHGVKAGTLVAVIKGLFQELDNFVPLKDSLERIHKTLRSMRFHNLFMGLTLLRLKKNEIIVSSAGMPPTLIYRKGKNLVEELKIKHLPLGGPDNNNFEEQTIQTSKGDIILFLTDGLPELFNKDKEMFGYQRIEKLIIDNADKPVNEIIQSLLYAADGWSNGSSQNDDITMIGIKVK